MPATITRDELLAALEQPGTVLIEALAAEQYEAEHLPGALNLPGDLDAGTAARLAPDRSALVVTYCSGEACRRSKTAARAFEQLGYTNVKVYEGGKDDWAQAGRPFHGTRAAAVHIGSQP
jgi:rhodanese-related sulfurtransferase